MHHNAATAVVAVMAMMAVMAVGLGLAAGQAKECKRRQDQSNAFHDLGPFGLTGELVVLKSSYRTRHAKAGAVCT